MNINGNYYFNKFKGKANQEGRPWTWTYCGWNFNPVVISVQEIFI